jgi:biopolymer transport protein ExbD/biopolymer transport protein TolR
MGGKIEGGDGAVINDINVTPMVDVMLVLLIIFVVITPMLQAGVSVALPKAKNPLETQDIVKETSVVIAIPNNEQIYINKDLVDFKQIQGEVKERLSKKPPQDQIVYIKSGAAVDYGTVVRVIDEVRTAGFDRIGLVADKEKEKKS